MMKRREKQAAEILVETCAAAMKNVMPRHSKQTVWAAICELWPSLFGRPMTSEEELQLKVNGVTPIMRRKSQC